MCLAVQAAIAKSSISDKQNAFKVFSEAAEGKSLGDMRDIAKDLLGEPLFFDWDRECSILLLVYVSLSCFSRFNVT